MIDHIGATEAELRNEVDLSQGDSKANDPGTKNQAEADPMAHRCGEWSGEYILVELDPINF